MEEIFEIENLEQKQISELKNLTEKQLQIVKENPFVEIINNETYDLAKKTRTNLVSARTEIEKQDRLIASKIKKFREATQSVTLELINITKPHEDKQQQEVKRFEKIKEDEKLEKIRIEEERKTKIKTKIETIFNKENQKIENLTFEMIDTLKVDFEQNLFKINSDEFEEFDFNFNLKLDSLKRKFEEKENLLVQLENQKIETEKLKKEREEFETKQKQQEDEILKQQQEIKRQQEELNAEKQRIEKIESERLAKIENERLAKIEAEKQKIESERLEKQKKEQQERLELLKPEKTKATEFINSLIFNSPMPKIENQDLLNHLEDFINEINQKQKESKEFINNLK